MERGDGICLMLEKDAVMRTDWKRRGIRAEQGGQLGCWYNTLGDG